MMVSKESITEQFEELGIEPSFDVIEKCLTLCTTYNVTDPVEFVEQWMAFSVSNLNGVEPTVAYLCDMERKEFSHKKEAFANVKIKSLNTTGGLTTPQMSSPKIYGNKNKNNIDEIDVMDTYVNKTPTTPKVQTSRISNNHDETVSTVTNISSPRSSNNQSNVSSSVVSGKVLFTFGNANLLQNTSWSTNVDDLMQQQQIFIPITLCETESYHYSVKYMFDLIMDKSRLHGNCLNSIGHAIFLKAYPSLLAATSTVNEINNKRDNDNNTSSSNINNHTVTTDNFERNEIYDELIHVDVPSVGRISCIGRIYSDLIEPGSNKLLMNSTFLIGLDDIRMRSVRLDFSKMNSISLFPGQIVVVHGYNPRGDIFYLHNIYTEQNLSIPKKPLITTTLNIVIASGPYTNSDNLSYEPLHDFILYCKTHKPQIIIMLGPFLDSEHKLIEDGDHLHNDSYDSYFEKMISGIMEAIGHDTQVLIVSSFKDAHSTMVYPTHPYKINRNYANVQFLPDPCIVNVNNLNIALTSTDIIGHLVETELVKNVSGDRIKRLVNYLFHQASFYPLHPPSITVPFDMSLTHKFATIRTIPHMIILPSDLKCFVRDINNCLAINPGRLATTPAVGTNGTFARMVISPSNEETSLYNYVACQVLKV